MSEIPRVWTDFNDILTRVDGKREVTGMWMPGMDYELREEVMLWDHDGIELPGVVCGIKDHGRGPFLCVEIP